MAWAFLFPSCCKDTQLKGRLSFVELPLKINHGNNHGKHNTIRDISASKEQITILIAHRLSTIMHADRIYVLEKGEVVETGTHESLLEEKGLYFAMWRQQIGERKKITIT